MTFEFSADYPLIRELLVDPRCLRRMAGGAADPDLVDVGARPGFEYILARGRDGGASAVFVLIDRSEIHFCFAPAVWGKTEPIARAFLAWVWAATDAVRLVGPVPDHNRLALRLAERVGFRKFAACSGHTLLEMRKP